MRDASLKITLRIGEDLHDVDPASLWSADIAYVTRGAVGVADMGGLYLHQYLGLLKTIEAQSG